MSQNLRHRAVVIGTVWPEPSSSAAGTRTLNLVQALLNAGWQVEFASAAKRTESSFALSQWGVGEHPIELNASSFDSWIGALHPEIVIFDRFLTEEQFGWRVEQTCPNALRVLDTIDLHFLRRERERTCRKEPGADVSSWEFALQALRTEDALRELGSIYRSDLAWVVSDFEADLLVRGAGVPSERVRVSRFGYSEEPQAGASFGERRGFVMIGNFRHAPNLDAVHWLHREIWPEIRKRLPGAEVRIYGAYPPREAMALDDSKSGFRLLGEARDVREVMAAARVNLAPLRFGAGIKGKILDGWWSGLPCVTTPIGAEGMSEGRDWPGRIELSPLAIAESAVALHEEEGLWLRAREQALDLGRALYLESAIAARLIEDLRQALSRREQSRAGDLVGAMLRLHQHRSTMYFSKWIEAKNRLTST